MRQRTRDNKRRKDRPRGSKENDKLRVNIQSQSESQRCSKRMKDKQS